MKQMEEKVGAKILDGQATAKTIRESLACQIKEFISAGHRNPGLAVVLIGENPASQVYVKNKVAACKKTGIESFQYNLPDNVQESVVLELLNKLNNRQDVDGILVQLPLPSGLNTEKILAYVDSKKDADGLHPYNMGLLLSGKQGLRPCTPSGIIAMLDHYQIPIAGKNAVVIGRSNLVGKPIAIMLMERNATVTICHSKTQGLDAICKQADILVVAAGRKEFVRGSWIKQGSAVIDVGIHKVESSDGQSSLCGDVCFEEASQLASYITPVPGGVGPMTVAMLLKNTVQAYKQNLSL